MKFAAERAHPVAAPPTSVNFLFQSWIRADAIRTPGGSATVPSSRPARKCRTALLSGGLPYSSSNETVLSSANTSAPRLRSSSVAASRVIRAPSR